MRLEVWPVTELAGALRLALLKDESQGHLELTVVNAFGMPVPNGSILRIRPDGYLQRYTEVNKELGFQLDRQGRVLMID